MSVLDHMTTAEYMKLRYGDRARRNWWGIAHRWWLLDSGQYIRTSERQWKIIGEDGPELVHFGDPEARRIISAKALDEMDDE